MNNSIKVKKIKNETDKFGIIYYLITGIIIGAGSILPAFSGGSMAVAMDIYDKMIFTANECLRLLKYIIFPDEEFISKYIDREDSQKLNIFQRFILVVRVGIKNYGSFVIPLMIGGMISVLLLARIINYALEKNMLLVTSIFLGLMIGTIPQMFGEAKNSKDEKLEEKRSNAKIKTSKKKNMLINILIFSAITIIVASLTFLEPFIKAQEVTYIFTNSLPDILMLLLLGALIAFSLIVPGVSGTLILMMMGRYKAILHILNTFDIPKILLCGLGAIIGAIPIFLIMEKLLKDYKQKTYFGILGFVIGSIIKIVYENFASATLSIFSVQGLGIIGIILVSALVALMLLKFAKKITNKTDENN